MIQLSIRLLGAPAIERDGAPVTMDTRKATALLAYLAVTDHPHARETLAGLLWPEYDDEHARAALRRTLSTLRTALGEAHLAIDRETAGLIPGAGLAIDVAEFRARLAACATHGHPPADICPACLSSLAQAVTLYRDDFLAGFTLRDSVEFDDWQFSQAERLRVELAEALEKLARGYGALGDFAAALVSARRWLELDPLREEAHRQVMRLFAWSGQRNAALRQYRECVRILEQELGVAPLAETTELYEAIKGNRLPPPDLSGLPRFDRSQAVPGPDLTGVQKPASSLPLVGRAAELATLIQAYDRHAASGFCVALEGEAGIGKTRLAEELLAHAQDKGAATITVRCYEGEALAAFGPIADGLRGVLARSACAERLDAIPAHWLTEAARLLPELSARRPDLPLPPPLEAPGGQSRFFEGLCRVLGAICQGAAPNVLFFDDMHWADAASLDLLAYLVRRLRSQSLFILATWRGDAGPAVPRLRSLLAEAQRAGLGATLTLPRLTLFDVLELVRDLAAAGADLPDDAGDRLYDETEGLPFFLVAYIDALLSSKARNWTIPQSVRDVLHARLNTVLPVARQLLQAAAVLGRSFDLELVRAISGRSDEETVTALESLIAHQLLSEVAGHGGTAGVSYDFSHEKLRTLVWEETSLARRRLLHGRVAQALVERSHRQHKNDALDGQIAEHYRLAGQEAEAAGYFVRAGEHARHLYAHTEALAHFQAALALGHPHAVTLHEAIADLLTLTGDYNGALDSLEMAAALCESAGASAGTALAGIEHKLANLHGRRGEWLAAQSHFEAAIVPWVERNNQRELARVYADWSLLAHQQGQTGRATELAQSALDAAESAGDPRSTAQAHNILGILARARGDFDAATRHLELSLASAEAQNDAMMRVATLNNLALVCGDTGNHEQAIALVRTALVSCQRLGDRHREAALHNNLADQLHAIGNNGDAMAHLRQAATIFAEIGAQVDDTQPEIWKLTEW